MLAVSDELSVEGGGDRLTAESLVNLLAVPLIGNAAALRPPARRTDSALPRTKLHAVVGYIEEHLDTDLTLAQLAATVHLSAYHLARQFKAATGVPPRQYVLTRRVERAQQLLRKTDLPLVDIAASAGFSDQSKLSAHFKRSSVSRPDNSASPQGSPKTPQGSPRPRPPRSLRFHGLARRGGWPMPSSKPAL